jgi:hypothetical protein
MVLFCPLILSFYPPYFNGIYFIIISWLRIFIESFVINILFVTQLLSGGYSSTSHQSIPQDTEVPPHVEAKRVIS